MPAPTDILVAGVEHAEVAARIQIAFDEEFATPVPPLDVLAARYRILLADPDGVVLLAGDLARPSGYAVVTLRPTVYCDGSLAVLDELYVRPDLRGQGLGTLLLERAIREAQHRGGGEMHINVDEVDEDARRFYERHGFVNVEPGTDWRMLLYVQTLPPTEETG